MEIGSMRVGSRYWCDARIVTCMCLAAETHGSTEPSAAYSDERDHYIWRPCSAFKALTARHFVNEIKSDYARPS